MSLYKRKGTAQWWVAFSVDGQRVQESAGTTDRRAAQEYHDRRRAELWEQRRLGVKPRRSWEEAVLRHLSESSHKRTLVTDRYHLAWMQAHLEGMELAAITRDVADQMVQAGLAEGAKPSTVNRRSQLLRAILRKAQADWEWIDRVPRLRMLKEPEGRTRWLSRDEAARLLAELPEHLRSMARFSLATGLRQGNVKGLRWAQIDLERCRAWVTAEEAKGRRAIPVPLNVEAMQVIEEHIGRHPQFVFTFQGKPITQVGTKAWRGALQRAGIENFRWHDLRHTWASWHAQNGTPLHVLQALGGWRDPAMVQRYAHLSMEHLEGYSARFAEQAKLSELAGYYSSATEEEDATRRGRLTH